MTAFDEDFRCEVVWSTAEWVSLLVSLDDFGKTEVSQTYISVLVHKNIFWFQITIYNILGMKMAKCHCYLNSIKTRPFLREAGDLTKVREKLTTSDKSHHEEYFMFCLEDIIHANKERMVCLHQNIFLKLCRFNLVIFDNYIFAKSFHSVSIVSSLTLYKKDFSKGTSTDNRFNYKVAEAYVCVFVWLCKARCNILLWYLFFIIWGMRTCVWSCISKRFVKILIA